MAFKLRSGNKTGFKGMGSSPVKKLDDKKTQTEIKNYIKNNMSKQSDSELASNVRKMSDNKTEYNWNTKTKEVEAHDLESKSPTKHFVDDVPDHNDGHSDDLQTPEEHEKGKVESPGKQKVYLTREEEEEAVDLTRKDGPRVTEKEKKDRQEKARQEREEANRFEHNVEAKMDEYPPKYFHGDIKRKEQKPKSPAKQKKEEKWESYYPITPEMEEKWKKEAEKAKIEDAKNYPRPKTKKTPVKQYENPSDRKKETPGQYWYKINNKPATKAEYIKYQNKPGGDEPGKQTNDPNVSLAKKSAEKRTKINK